MPDNGTFLSPYNEAIYSESFELRKLADIIASGTTDGLPAEISNISEISFQCCELAASAATGAQDQQYLCDGLQMVAVAEVNIASWWSSTVIPLGTTVPTDMTAWMKSASEVGITLTMVNINNTDNAAIAAALKAEAARLLSQALYIAAKYGSDPNLATLTSAILGIDSGFQYYINLVSGQPENGVNTLRQIYG